MILTLKIHLLKGNLIKGGKGHALEVIATETLNSALFKCVISNDVKVCDIEEFNSSTLIIKNLKVVISKAVL